MSFSSMDINNLLIKVRKTFWLDILELKDVKSRMTDKIRHEFYAQIELQSFMDFTENNIRSFIIQLIGNYENILNNAVEEIFDKMTAKYHWCDETSKNVHYFNGWKTNKSFYANKKVIMPMAGFHSNGSLDYSGRWKLDYDVRNKLHDIDVVMNYFDSQHSFVSIVESLESAFAEQKSRDIKSTYFTISVFKKGTIHLTFNDENILRRFNIIACKNKKWLNQDYGKKTYSDMSQEEKSIVDSFEGIESYTKNINQLGYANKTVKMLEGF
jgi:hypothetical protein